MGIAAAEFGGLITAMVTAFDSEGRLDLDRTVEVARYLEKQGNTALVLTGTTGEAPTLSDDEKLAIWETVAGAVSLPVIAGSGTNDTAHSADLTRRASEVGVAGILAVAPYYNRPSQAGLVAHFGAVADSTELPVIIYDIPVRTGRKVASDSLIDLARSHANIVGLKDAAGSPAATAELLGKVRSGFDVYSGDDSLTLPLMAIGAVGVIGVATHWASAFFAAMIDSFAKGEVARAAAINLVLGESYSFETSEAAPNPIPAKVMMSELGLSVGQCRLPLGPAPEGIERRARGVLANLRSSGSEFLISEAF